MLAGQASTTQNVGCPGLENVGNLGSSFPGNLTIWREIMTFHIKKYIRNSGKFVGNVNLFPGNFIFSSPADSPITTLIKSGEQDTIRISLYEAN